MGHLLVKFSRVNAFLSCTACFERSVTLLAGKLQFLQLSAELNDTWRLQWCIICEAYTQIKALLCLGCTLYFMFWQMFSQVCGPTPCITGEEEYGIAIDGSNILKGPIKSFQLAVEAWLATFWIFSIAFPDSIKNTTCYFEKVLLRKGGKVSAVVRKWCNRLKL